MTVPRHTFISYAHEDKGLVEEVASALRAEAIAVWFDVDMPNGRIESEVRKHLESARLVVVVLSDASASSNWVRSEFDYALELIDRGALAEDSLMILRTSETASDGFDLRAKSRKQIDITNSDEAVRAVMSAFGRMAASSTPASKRRSLAASGIVGLALGVVVTMLFGTSDAHSSANVSASEGDFLLEWNEVRMLRGLKLSAEIAAIDDLVLTSDQKAALKPFEKLYPGPLFKSTGFRWDRLLVDDHERNRTFQRIDEIVKFADTVTDERVELFTKVREGGDKPVFVELREIATKAELWVFPPKQRSCVCLRIQQLEPESTLKVKFGEDAGRFYERQEQNYVQELKRMKAEQITVPDAGRADVCAVMGDVITCVRRDGVELQIEICQVMNVPRVREDHDGCILKITEAVK